MWLLVCGCVHACAHMCVSVDKMLHFINTLILLLLFYVTVICDITDYPLKVPFFSLVCVCVRACMHVCVSADKNLCFINTSIRLLLFYVTVSVIIFDITDFPLKVPFRLRVCLHFVVILPCSRC